MEAKVVTLFASSQNNGYVTATIDLGTSRRFLAWASLSMIDPLNTFDRDNAVTAEVYQVNFVNHKWSWISGGDHWGANCSTLNAYQGATMAAGRYVTFRLRALHPEDLTAFATGIVLTLD